jgi:hypothetical protein
MDARVWGEKASVLGRRLSGKKISEEKTPCLSEGISEIRHFQVQEPRPELRMEVNGDPK